MDNNWSSPSQSVQNRITQAVSSAYQDYQDTGQQGWSSDCQGGMQQNYMQQHGGQQGWSDQNCQQGMMQQGCNQQGFINQNCQQGYADQYNCGGQYAQQQDCQQYGQYAQNGYQGQGDGSWQHGGSQNCGNWNGSDMQ